MEAPAPVREVKQFKEVGNGHIMTITDNAAKQVLEIMKAEHAEDSALRVGVNGGGCSGLEYFGGLDETVGEGDQVFDQPSGFRLVIDAQSLPYLQGARLDFSNDFQNSGFIFDNPNASRTCGCGKSFCG